ncbi:MAG TPA: DNA recombination protein RmuC [Acidimicrobiales bacterium]
MDIALAALLGIAVGIALGAAAMAVARRRQATEFRALAAQALAANNEQFLHLATTRFDTLEDASHREAMAREQAVEGLVQPIDQRLGDLQQALLTLDRRRAVEASELREMLTHLRSTTESLHGETRILATAMKDTRARGSWGELQLRRVVELAGLVEHCDFISQLTVSGDDGHLRPDLVVRLPEGRSVVVDAKVPMQAYLQAVETDDPETERGFLEAHGRAVAGHVEALRRRDYAHHVPGSIDVVVLFVPGDAFLSAAYAARPTLFDDAIGRGVFLATPVTLIALLRAVAFGWRQERLAESSAEIVRLGEELHQRVGTFADHLAKVGGALDRATRSYNEAVGSLESRVLVTTRRLAGHGVGTAAVTAPETVDTAVRPLTAVELTETEQEDHEMPRDLAV